MQLKDFLIILVYNGIIREKSVEDKSLQYYWERIKLF